MEKLQMKTPTIYTCTEDMLRAITIKNEGEGDILLGEDLDLLKKNLRRSSNHITQVYYNCVCQNIALLSQVLMGQFETHSVFELNLPENFELSRGIINNIKELLLDIEGQIDDDYVIIFVKGFTKLAATTPINHAQPYTHLYNQNTVEDLEAASNNTPSVKTLSDKKYRVLIVTIIDDSEGLEIQKIIYQQAVKSDFTMKIDLQRS